MSNIAIRKAERRKAKLRVGIFGPSGSGKSMSALKIAHGIAPWEKICVIDTENGSADLYSHLGPYNVIPIAPPYEPEVYVKAIKAAEGAGMEVIVIDSITHEWDGTGGMLDISTALIPSLKDGKLIWQRITPRHNAFIDAIKFSPAHMICCGRSKTDNVINQKNRNGMTVSEAEKIGLKAITREGFEYEMTIAFDLAINHYATCNKDRTTGDDGLALFQDKPARVLEESVGAALKKWGEEGKVDLGEVKRSVMHEIKNRLAFSLPVEAEHQRAFIEDVARKLTGYELTDENLELILAGLKSYTPEQAKQVMLPKPKPPEDLPPPNAGVAEVIPQKISTPTAPQAPTSAPEAKQAPEAAPAVAEPPKTLEQKLESVFGSEANPNGEIKWRDRAKMCTTVDEARVVLHEMTDAGAPPSEIGMIRGIFVARGILHEKSPQAT